MKDDDKVRVLAAVQQLVGTGFSVVATHGTQRFLADNGIDCMRVNKVKEGRPHIVDLMKNGDVQIVVNTTSGSEALQDSKSIRRAALLQKIPYYTTLAGASAAAEAIAAKTHETLEVRPLQDYLATSK